MIDLEVHVDGRKRAIGRAKERGIVIPTFSQMRDPSLVPENIRERLSGTGLWDTDPGNLFRITWKNEPVTSGGGFGGVNYIELPGSLTGVRARIIALAGRWFPTGSHKVGATFGCLVPRLVTGQFDPTSQKAVWPSTGNFCRGGAYNSTLLACESIALLPEGMSRERFDWLAGHASEVIKTPGSESNVKEIFDKCRELKASGREVVIFNQFEEFGNYIWHYEVTGRAMEEVLERELAPDEKFRGIAVTSGSAGTLACGDYLKGLFPAMKIAAGEALQCPTMMENGFGSHRIEGIGDKHVPWIHNVKNTDMVVAVDDEAVVSLARLFNEEEGRRLLAARDVPEEVIGNLDLLGFSSIANLIIAIKFVRYYELGEGDLVLTVFTDSMDLYGSRLQEMAGERGEYSQLEASADHARYLQGVTTDHTEELRHTDRRRIHNLKYYTWIEQQGKTADELTAQWSDRGYWTDIQEKVDEIDALIEEFNRG